MSHRCPECDQLCFCMGDIDDCMLPGGERTCTHYLICGEEHESDEDWREEDAEEEKP